jgi:hypothetical protein
MKQKHLNISGDQLKDAGKNVYPLVGFDGTGFRYSTKVDIKKTGNTYMLAPNAGTWFFGESADHL